MCVMALLAPLVPRSVQLGQCDLSTNQFPFTVPDGDRWNLVISGPHLNHLSSLASIRSRRPILKLGISDESGMVYQRQVTSTNIRQCNWLSRHGIAEAYILTLPGADMPRSLEDSVKAGQKCTVSIVFDEEAPNGTFLWLVWMGRPRVAGR